ncbi:MAG: hypothetical protein JNL02_13580 [Saprospiraceae bacterium]|nr:hypothetical protein [Saprospiraceae bacterium]
MPPKKVVLRQWLSNGDTAQVVDALQQIANELDDKYLRQDIIHQAGRFNSLQKDRSLGIIDNDTYFQRFNAIQLALQDLIERLPDVLQPAAAPPVNDPPPSTGNTTSPAPATPPTTAAGPVSNLPWIIGLLLLLGPAIALAAFLPCPSASVENTFRLLMALGAGGIATLLPGVFHLEFKGLKAGSAIGITALVYLVNPAGVVKDDSPCNEPKTTSVTVFVHGKKGTHDMIPRQQGSVIMDVPGGERKRASINEYGQAFFQNLVVGDSVRIDVDFSEPYHATRPGRSYRVEPQGSIYLEVALQGLDKVFGTVLAGDKALPGVVAAIGALRDTTDETGYYEIAIPEPLQQKQYEVKFTRAGYKLLTKPAYPQTGAPLNVVMNK